MENKMNCKGNCLHCTDKCNTKSNTNQHGNSELKDEEVIKALEVHSNEKFDNCEGCPYLKGDFCEGYTVSSKPFKDILDLINRQKAEIISRTEEYNDMLEQRNKVEEALEFKIMDVNSLTSERDALEEMVAEQKAEVERLQKKVNYLKDADKRKDAHLHVRLVEQAKSEAIKEFAKKHREIIMAFCDDDDQISLKVCEYDANTDNLVKELTE